MQEAQQKMDLIEKTIETREIFSGRIITVRVDTVTLPNGSQSTREVVEHAEDVAIVALDDKNNIIMVKQYRKPVEKVLMEIPAGIMEINEEPLLSAKRELKEETGFSADHWEKILGYFTTPGFTDEYIHVYLARGLTEGELNLDEDEFVETVRLPLEEAGRMITTGEIVDGKSIIGILSAIGQQHK
jgi:ADP-ribose pyrophosphatase